MSEKARKKNIKWHTHSSGVLKFRLLRLWFRSIQVICNAQSGRPINANRAKDIRGKKLIITRYKLVSVCTI